MSTEDQILAELKAINQNLSRGSPFANNNGPTGAQAAQQFVTGGTNVLSSFSKLAQGSYDLTAAINDVNKFLGIFGGVGEALSGVFGTAITELKSMNDAMNMSSRYGVGFSQNLFQYTKELGQAGISFADFNRVLETSGQRLTGMGQSSQESMQIFLANSAALRTSERVIRAELMGVKFSEFQEQLISTQSLMKFIDADRVRLNKSVQETTIAAVIEIDNMARITGKSRQEIQKNTDTAAQSRLMSVAMLSMTEEQTKAYARLAPYVSNMGTPLRDVFQQFMSFGNVVTPETTAAVAGMNTAFPGFASKLKELANPNLSAGRQEELKRELEFIVARAASNPEQMERLKIGAVRQEPWAVAMTDYIKENGAFIATAKERFRAAGGDFETYKRNSEEAMKFREMIDNKKLTADQLGGPGAVVSQIINGLERAIGAGQSAAGNYISELQEKTGLALKGLNMNDAVDKIINIQRLDKTKLEEFAKEKLGWTGVDTKDPTNPKPKEGTSPRYDRLGYTTQDPLPVRVTNSAGSREFGTKGKADSDTRISKWMEDFGTESFLFAHGKEGMIRQDQSMEFAMDTLAESGILGPLMAGLGNRLSEVKNSNQAPDMFKDIVAAVNSIPKQLNIPNTPSTVATNSDGEILQMLLERLNTKMDKLITAVEDGSRGTVKAVKAGNNMIG